jgi:hypothetical protein
MNYERDAVSYSLGLLHDCGIRDADQWLAEYAACDAAYLRHFYLTGEKRDFRSFWRDAVEKIPARAVPQFSLIIRAFRSDGIVI